MGTAFGSPAWQRGGDGRRQAEAVQRLGRLLEQRVPVFGERGRASPLRAVGRRAGRGCRPCHQGWVGGWVGGWRRAFPRPPRAEGLRAGGGLVRPLPSRAAPSPARHPRCSLPINENGALEHL